MYYPRTKLKSDLRAFFSRRDKAKAMAYKEKKEKKRTDKEQFSLLTRVGVAKERSRQRNKNTKPKFGEEGYKYIPKKPTKNPKTFRNPIK